MTTPLLVLEDIHGGYGDVDILNGISLSIAPGEIVTIAGTNGAGKSTLAKAILGLLPRVTGPCCSRGTSSSAYRRSIASPPASATCPRWRTSFPR